MTNNSHLSRGLQPTVCVLEDQAIWSTGIASSELDCRVTRGSKIDDLVSQCSATHGSLAVIEIDLSHRGGTTNNTFLAINSAIQRLICCPFFAVGDKRLKKHHNQLLAVGFTEVFGGIADIDRLVRLAQRHFTAVQWPAMSCEERVMRCLPWQPINGIRLSKTQN